MYDPITNKPRSLLVVRIMLTICAMEFFGPWVKDYSESHLFNPDWVGHARVHMMWLLGFFLFSGIANMYLIWFVRPLRQIHLYVSFAWLAANLLGFWVAIAMVPVYDGVIVVPEHHIMILGVEENIFVFSVLSAILLGAFGLFQFIVKPQLDSDAS